MPTALIIKLVILDWFGVVNSELTTLFNQIFDTSPQQQARIKDTNDLSDSGEADVDAVYQMYADIMTEQTGTKHQPHDAKVWLDAHSGVDWKLIELVQSMRRNGVKVVVGSNAASDHYSNLVSDGMLDHFDGIYVSSTMGANIKKPDAAFFDFILRDMDVDPRETLFIDDNAGHVEGARKAGLNAEQYGAWGDMITARRILGKYQLI